MIGPEAPPVRFPAAARYMKCFPLIFAVLVLGASLGCRDRTASPPARLPVSPAGAGFVTVAGRRFLDASGKPVVFHGINVVKKSKAAGYLGDLAAEDFAAIRSWG